MLFSAVPLSVKLRDLGILHGLPVCTMVWAVLLYVQVLSLERVQAERGEDPWPSSGIWKRKW